MNLKNIAAATLLLSGIGLTTLAPKALHADPTNGASSNDTTVIHGTDDVYHVKYNGGEQGDVHVVADDDSDDASLEIKVYDPDGNLVARDYGSDGHSPAVSFDVDRHWQWREYTIKVVNLSYHTIGYDVQFF